MTWLRFPRTLALVAVCYLLAMAVVFALLAAQGSAFARQAQQTSGTVVALVPRAPLGSTRDPRSDRAASLAPRVQYSVAGTTYDYTAAHGRYRQRLRVGDTVTVLYAPAEPQRARLLGEGQRLGPLLAGGFGLGALAVALVLVRTRPSRAKNADQRDAHPSASRRRARQSAS